MTIKPWRERAGLSPAYELHNPSTVEKAMQEEIAELRERLEEIESMAEDRRYW